MTTSQGKIVKLNVGGVNFATTADTLTWIGDSFFSSLLSGRVPSIKDDNNAYFIDRDPEVFSVILNYLRTRHLSSSIDVSVLKGEAEFYGLTPLVQQLNFCQRGHDDSIACCGGILFHCFIPPSVAPNTHAISNINRSVNGPVCLLAGNNHWIVAAVSSEVICYRYKEAFGWYRVWTSPAQASSVTAIAINARYQPPGPTAASQRLIAMAISNVVKIFSFIEEGAESRELQSMTLDSPVSSLFFMGTHLVGLSFESGCVALWHGLAQQWQMQRLPKITSCDRTSAGLLLLGSVSGVIYCIDLQKFPVRMRDNDVLVVKLFEDPLQEAITALSVYVPASRNSIPVSDNWLEVAYGTANGTVRIIVQHPEYFSQSPTLFLTFTVHMSPVIAVKLSDRFLMTVCSSKHARTWAVNRFRGMLSTQPGSSAIASFDLFNFNSDTCGVEFEDSGKVVPPSISYPAQTMLSPFGHQDDDQLMLNQLVSGSDSINVIQASTGSLVCTVKSVDGSPVTSVLPLYWESQLRMTTSNRFLFTGHASGSIQMWNLSTALDQQAFRNANQVTTQDCIQAINDLPSSS